MNDMSHTQTQTLTQRTDDSLEEKKRILSVNDKQNVVCERWTERTAKWCAAQAESGDRLADQVPTGRKSRDDQQRGETFFSVGGKEEKKREKVGGS